MINLAVGYSRLNQLKDAVQFEGKTLEAKERTLGGEHFKTLQSIANLAIIYNYLGRYNKVG
jgi:hypothetical protein